MKAKLLGIMAVAGFAGVMTAGAAVVTSDDFNRTNWDYSKWQVYSSNTANSQVGQSLGYAWFKKDVNVTGDTWGMTSVGDLHTEQGFDMSIDYSLTWDQQNHDNWRLTYDVMYLTVNANSHKVELRRQLYNFDPAYYALFVDDVYQTGITVAFTPETAESMRLARVGNTLTAYAKTSPSTDWQTVGTCNVGSLFSSFDTSANLQVLLGVNTDREGFMQVDNFSIVPEPASLALLAMGGLLVCRRKRG